MIEYRDNLEEIRTGKYEDKKNSDENEVNNEDEELENNKGKRKKEFYIKTRVLLLWLLVKHLDIKAINHRKMIIRYITLNQIQINQIGTALWYVRKLGTGIIEQEDFEKVCGIGNYSDLFGFALWKGEHTSTDILHLNESERRRKKEDKLIQKQREINEIKRKQEEDEREAKLQKQLKEQLEKAEKEADEKIKSEKWRKLTDARKKEDEIVAENRKREDQLKEKRREKHDVDMKKRKQQRELEYKQIDTQLKKREEELQYKKDDRYRKQRQEMAQRMADRKSNMLDLGVTTLSGRKL